MKPKLIKGTITIALMCFAATGFSQGQKYKFPFQDPNLTFDQRVEDLVSRMTLEEKVAQMLNKAPAIKRLDIPAYDWWNEVLHGVARSPYNVTVYPQAIAMAATWDTQSLKTMADYSATEGRAIYAKTIENGKAGQRYTGLTYWSPNVNIFRDPRWGRGQETYGEDPYLTAMMGKAFVQGLQGDDPKYLKSAACAKHYAVHSGPEKLRHVFDVTPSGYDLWNTYLPAFKELVVNANVAGVMCAYNAFHSQPCCGNDLLMVDILRNQWKFKGYVTSDCWGIEDFYKNHKTQPNAEHASADAVVHGTDVECGTSAYYTLVDAVKSNIISEKQIDVSVKRLFMVRFRLGMFDPASMVKYANTPISVLESEPHKAQALKMARESMVLLKNSHNVLPLKKNIRKIAVVGPNADNEFSVLGNYNGVPSQIETALKGIKDKVGKNVEVVYEKGVNFTNDTLLQVENISKLCSIDGKQGFKAEYFNNTSLSGTPVLTRMEKQLDNFWQEGEQITETLKAYNFSARYTSDFTAEKTDKMTFELVADDGFQFYVDGKMLIGAWANKSGELKNTTLNTVKGTTYHLEVRYKQKDGKASVKLTAGKYEKMDFMALANRLKDADAIVYVGGISPQLEGEDMQVNAPGFDGGDRTSILLPAVQTELLKALKSTGKPVVFVMMTGSALAIPWEAENIPAIINAWYGGQSAGTAIADVLFGDYNPSGRLPVTFYKSDSDLPGFTDYSMDNRTYRYFKGEPLFPFGFGLSYTTFKYDKLQVPENIVKGKALPVSVQVTNSGKRDGDEVLQLYVSYPNSDLKTPIRALKGFQRISLKKGESKNVQFLLQPEDLSISNESGQAIQPLGNYVISVGGGQTGNVVKSTVNVIRLNK
jgi:beta-glucosidase